MSDTSPIVQLTAFRVGDEEYVVDILRVVEIIRPVPVTPVRKGPKFVEGVITLRGAVIPIIDMRRRFGLDPEQNDHGRIIVLSVDNRSFGLVVDAVTEVVRVPRKSIRPAPGMFDSGRAPFFMGVCHFQERTLILLNVRNVVGSDEEIEIPTVEGVMSGDV